MANQFGLLKIKFGDCDLLQLLKKTMFSISFRVPFYQLTTKTF